MEKFRAIIVAAVALSLAVLPVSGAAMRSSMAAGTAATAEQMADKHDVTAHAECCPQSGDCETQTKKGCGDSGACLLKCTLLPAAQVAVMDHLAAPPKASPKLAVLTERLSSTPVHPPLPPPRA